LSFLSSEGKLFLLDILWYMSATPECPVYSKKCQTPDAIPSDRLYLISCDIGRPEKIVVCKGSYEATADWLVDVLQGKPLEGITEFHPDFAVGPLPAAV
jgi:hypothetical protein